MAYTYIHIVENYFVKPSRAGYVLGTLQTKKGGQRKLMNGVTYGSLTEAMEAAVRNVIAGSQEPTGDSGKGTAPQRGNFCQRANSQCTFPSEDTSQK